MLPKDLTDRQRKMVLERTLDDNIIATRLGTNVREVKRLRERMKDDTKKEEALIYSQNAS